MAESQRAEQSEEESYAEEAGSEMESEEGEIEEEFEMEFRRPDHANVQPYQYEPELDADEAAEADIVRRRGPEADKDIENRLGNNSW